jgi:co-chaperonin GroES (HSP10)
MKTIVLVPYQEFSQEERIVEGVVSEVGVECKFVKKGDRIIFDHYQTDPLDIAGEKYISMLESNIIAIL